MAGEYDATAKFLVQNFPRDCLSLLGHQALGDVQVIESDLSTVAAEADKVLHVSGPVPHLVHLEFQASADPRMGLRLLRYNVMLQHEHGLPVSSALVLLRPSADGSSMRGTWQMDAPDGHGRIRFRYRVIQIWSLPVQRLLEGPLGTVPLAPLASFPEEQLSDVVRATRRRIEQELSAPEAQTMDMVTFILMGLRYPLELVNHLYEGVQRMRESSTYMAILDEGRAEGRAEGEARGRASEARGLLLLMGEAKFGAPDGATRAALEGIDDLARLERMGPRLLTAASWAELLATP